MSRTDPADGPAPPVSNGARPSMARAAAAARLAGAGAGEAEVADRMRQAARRSRQAPPAALSNGLAGLSNGAAALAVAAPVAPPRPGRPEEARPRHLRVVPDRALSPAQRRRRARALVVVGIVGAATIGLSLVYFHVVLAQRQFALDRLDTQVQQAQATYQQSRLQIAQLGSPQHIISMAEGQLGMVQPGNVTYLTPTAGAGASGSSLVSPRPGTPAPAGDANWPDIKSQLAGSP